MNIWLNKLHFIFNALKFSHILSIDISQDDIHISLINLNHFVLEKLFNENCMMIEHLILTQLVIITFFVHYIYLYTISFMTKKENE